MTVLNNNESQQGGGCSSTLAEDNNEDTHQKKVHIFAPSTSYIIRLLSFLRTHAWFTFSDVWMHLAPLIIVTPFLPPNL